MFLNIIDFIENTSTFVFLFISILFFIIGINYLMIGKNLGDNGILFSGIFSFFIFTSFMLLILVKML